jgi:hypothetical protein
MKRATLIFLTVGLLLSLTVGVALAATNYYTNTKTHNVVAGGVQVIRFSTTARHGWNTASPYNAVCGGSGYPSGSYTSLKTGWSAALSYKTCFNPVPNNASSQRVWNVYYNGVLKGQANISVTSVADSTPPNWSWSFSESVP